MDLSGRLRGLDLFSGIGGISLALEPWVQTVAYCENDRYAQAVLLTRMRSGELETAPIWDDVRTLRAGSLPAIDIISGGFPCQDISVAGAGKGLAGERSGLFFEIARLAAELRPRWIFLENVPGIRTRGLDVVCKELEALRYDLRWTVVSAAEVGAPHLRKRWFLLAHSNRIGVRDKSDGQSECQSKTILGHDGKDWIFTHTESKRRSEGRPESGAGRGANTFCDSRTVADSHLKGLEGWDGGGLQECSGERASGTGGSRGAENNWITEPDVGRVVNGLPCRVDRIRCLGNSVVPLQVQTAFKRLAGLE